MIRLTNINSISTDYAFTDGVIIYRKKGCYRPSILRMVTGKRMRLAIDELK